MDYGWRKHHKSTSMVYLEKQFLVIFIT